LQKLYGRDVANSGTIIDLFQRMMGKYPADKVIRAFEIWMERSQEFPTPADIISLIKRNGKPPLKESDIIAIRKKDGQDRTPDDWKKLHEWENEQKGGGESDNDAQARVHTDRVENTRLRLRVAELEAKNAKAWGIVKNMRSITPVAKISPSAPEDDKIQRTISHLIAAGVPENIINEFKEEAGNA